MTTNAWTRVTHHEFAHNTGVRVSRGGASLQACVLVLLFAAAVLRERDRCIARLLFEADLNDGCVFKSGMRNAAQAHAEALRVVANNLSEDEHAEERWDRLDRIEHNHFWTQPA